MKDEPNKITATLKVVIAGEFYDDEASEETLRYCVEQDLEDAGFDVDVALMNEQEEIAAKPGRWIRMTGFMPPEYYGHYECSECGWHGGGYQPVEDKFAFCPNCGARMTGVQMHG